MAGLKRISCGVIVTDGGRLLLGHATRSPRWDIPKGIMGAGEAPAAAAVRELQEETGLAVAAAALVPLGTHAYLRDKDLCLFAWRPAALPDPQALRCSSMVQLPGGGSMPELDRFGLFEWEAGLALVGRSLARVLGALGPSLRG